MWAQGVLSAASSSPSSLAEGPAAVRIGRGGWSGRLDNFFRRFGKKRVRRVRTAARASDPDASGEAQGAQGFPDEAAPAAGGADAALTAGYRRLNPGEAMDRRHVRRPVIEEKLADHARQDDTAMRQDRT